MLQLLNNNIRKKKTKNLLMNIRYLDLYNNLIKLTTNKYLYKNINKQDTFSDRLTLFLVHFAFFLKVFKNNDNEKILQEIYDFNFRQLELSLREIGYGDQSINKKMKDYINVFHSIISEIHFWEDLDKINKEKKISLFLQDFNNIEYLIDYFDEFRVNLSKNTLNFYLKSVSTQ
jgi:cytochrome b pre-mRNA-processing protein 3